MTGIVALILLLVAAIGCKDAGGRARSIRKGERPEEIPVMLNTELPFRYPADLYAQKVQGNVTLRLLIDSAGGVRPESTQVHESSGYTGLDSAAVVGSSALRFSPALSHGVPVSIPVLFPVYFRHPDAAPLPGDTILRGPRGQGSGARK